MRTNGKWILILMIVLAGILLPSSTVSAAGETPGVGSTVTFAGTDWLCIGADPVNGYKLLRTAVLPDGAKKFHYTTGVTFTDSDIRTYLNDTYYNTFNADEKSVIQSSTWNCGEAGNEGSVTATDYVGLLTLSEYNSINTQTWYVITDSFWWLITDYSTEFFPSGSKWSVDERFYPSFVNVASFGNESTAISVRPSLYLKPDTSFTLTDGKYVVLYSPPTPSFNPAAGAIAFGSMVEITSAGADHIYYTTDGIDPATSAGGSTLEYTGPVTVNEGLTIKAIAVKAGYPDSAIGSADYTQAESADLTGLTLSGTPSNFTFAGGTYTYEGVTVSNGASSIAVTPTGAGTIMVDGIPVTSGQVSEAIALTVGVEKTIMVVVTETGKLAKTYTIKVTREIGETDFQFDGTGTITGYTGPGGDVEIPSTIGGEAVTAIGNNAFNNCDILTSVTIPDSVTSIGQMAFAYCDNLTSATIPGSVNSWGTGAFAICPNLVNVTLNYGLISIGNDVFDSTGLTSIDIPASVTSIDDFAFYNCQSLTSVTIPANVTNIGEFAFNYCNNLTRARFMGDAPTLDAGVFGDSSADFKMNYLYGNASFVLTDGKWYGYDVTPLFTVTYDGNGSESGSVPVDGNLYEAGNTVNVPGNTGSLEKPGHTFAGWNTAADVSGAGYGGGGSFSMTDTGHVTLYAQWTITAASVSGITAPAAGAEAQTVGSLTAGDASYTVTGLTWQNGDGTAATLTAEGKFKAGSIYQAVIELTAAAGYKFQALIPTVDAGTAGAGTIDVDAEGNKLTFTVTFPATAAQSVSAIVVKTQPTKLTYTAGEILDLTGIVATLTYNDGTTADVALTDFGANGITANLDQGTAMEVATHNGQTVTLTCNTHTAETSSLSVSTATTQATPSFNPAGGAIAFGSEVVITSDGADHIYYTTDGTDPVTAVGGSTQEYTVPITVNSAMTIKAIAVKTGNLDSAVGSASYTQAESADLTDIVLSGNPTGFVFSGGTYAYDGVTVSNSVYGIAVTPIGAGIITVNGTEIASGTASENITLAPGVEKTIVVAATEAGRTVKTYTIKVTRKTLNVPQAPVIISANEGDESVDITWTEVPGSTGYKIFSSTTSGDYTDPPATVAGYVYGYEDTGLTNGQTYYYIVKAVKDGVDSPSSYQVSAAPGTVPDVPENVKATAGNGQVTVSFTEPADNGGRPINKYIAASSPGNVTAEGTGTVITVTGLTNGITYTFTVQAVNRFGSSQASTASNAVMPYRPSSGGDSKDDEPSTSTAPTTPAAPKTSTSSGEIGVDILVNGKAETAATATTTIIHDKTVTTVAVDDKKVEEKLQQAGNSAVVTIMVKNDADTVIGTLNGQTVKNMETKEAVLEIKTNNVAYTLPAQQINIDAVSEQIGKQVALKDITVSIKISEPNSDTVKIVEDTADKGNYQLVIKPVEFEITCSNGDKTVVVSKFNAYVERTIAIPEGINPDKITTGIVINPDGSFSHVPTAVVVIDGKYYARINSLTNSTYSIIYNPGTFKDVEGHWAKEVIDDMGSRLVVSGVGEEKFEPDGDITRAEFAAVVVRSLGLMCPGTGKDAFSDVLKGTWYYDAVSIAYEYGIISGNGNGEFGPMDKIKREQAMAMVLRAMKITGLKLEFNEGEMEQLFSEFKDSDNTAGYAKSGAAACIKAEIILGRNGSQVAPKENITRAEAAVIMQRLLRKSGLI